MRRRSARRAEEFAAALEGRVGGPTDAVAPMLAIARQLQALPVGPQPEFRDALRSRLVAVATVSPATVPVPEVPFAQRVQAWVGSWRVQRSIAAASAGMAAVIGITGVATAGSRSVPGDPFYGVKKTAEAAQLVVARDDVHRGTRYLQHAETRLDEVKKLVGNTGPETFALAPQQPAAAGFALGGNRSTRVAKALAAMDESTQKGTKLLTTAYLRTRNPETLKVVASFAERQHTELVSVLPVLPTLTHPRAVVSLELVDRVAERADALLVSGVCTINCAPAPTQSPTSPSPTPQPSPSPSDSLGPTPCNCPSPSPDGEPSPAPSESSQPSPGPSESPSPEPTPSGSDTPSPDPSGSPTVIPTIAPGPVRSPIEDLLRRLPTPTRLSPPGGD
ncbi:MAG: DUF5667 domain-containing protein [Mycobacteriales bacterium]